MKATISAVPYVAGRLAAGMGLGPVKYLAAQPEAALAAAGHDVEVVELRPRLDPAFDEPAVVVGIDAVLADVAAAKLAAGRSPLVLAGDCNSALGMIAGMQAAGATRVGIVWFDAHGGLNTPDTSPGGVFDGMGLAIATGRTRADVAAAIGVRPVAEAHVPHLGARDLDPPEIAYLASGVMPSIGVAALQADVGTPGGALGAALAALRAATDQGLPAYRHRRARGRLRSRCRLSVRRWPVAGRARERARARRRRAPGACRGARFLRSRS